MDSVDFKPLNGLNELVTKSITYNTTVLGRGSYAAVYKAKCDELPCAVKILHSIFQEDPDVASLAESFNRECEYLKNIRHPNIVQYLGLCRDPQTHHPALLMELLDQSLTRFLESSNDPLPFRIEINISHDTALALAHLHSIGIVHRDLSSNNVLLIGAGNRAKVCDFGMSKVIEARNSRLTSLHSKCPGTVAYMPPEALTEVPGYTEKMDCFSFGVLSIQIMTKQFPNPTARTKQIESPLSLTGMVTVPILETECRKDHIDMINQSHPLLGIAIRCLALVKEERPSAHDLCEQLEEIQIGLVGTPETGSEKSIIEVPTTMANECRCLELETITQAKDEEIANLHQQLGVRQVEVDTLLDRISDIESTKQNLEVEVVQLRQDMEESINANNRQVERCTSLEQIKKSQEGTISSLREELEEMSSLYNPQAKRYEELDKRVHEQEEKVKAIQERLDEQLSINYIQLEKCHELQTTKEKQTDEIANLLHQLGEKLNLDAENDTADEVVQSEQHSVETQDPPPTYSIIGDWMVGTAAPYSVADSSTAVLGNGIFYGFPQSVCHFNVMTNTWLQLPNFRSTYKRLHLFADVESDTLYALKDNELYHFHEHKWLHIQDLWAQFGNTAACVYYYYHIIKISSGRVLGLYYTSGKFVNSFNTPAIDLGSCCACNGWLYIVGEFVLNNKIYRASLADIVRKRKKVVLGFKKEIFIQWEELSPPPFTDSAYVNFQERLLAIGGHSQGKASNMILVFNEVSKLWQVVGHLPTARYSCIVSVVGNKLVVVGGWSNSFTMCSRVEIAQVNIQVL